MKNLLSVLVVLTMLSTAVAYADFQGPNSYPAGQGFQGPSMSVSNKVVAVKDVKNMYDDQIAIVRGHIVSRISDDKYLFKDASGEMIVEIDYKYWSGVQATDKDVVELKGKVDRDYDGVTLDVFMISKVK